MLTFMGESNRIEHAMRDFHRELAAKRLDRLRELIRQSRVVGVEEASRRLRVSAATVRRDLDQLENLGEVQRVHGGAVGIDSLLQEPLFDDKTALAAKQKHRIARAALKFIKANHTVYLDGGSTVLELARMIRDRTSLTVVTNSLRAALELAAPGPRLILIGGELRRLSQTMVGPLTRQLLDQLNVDVAFMGTIGLSLEAGLTTTDPAEAYTKELVMAKAREVVLLADSTKLGRVSFAQAGRLDCVRTLITDSRADQQLVAELHKKGIETIQV